MDVTDERVLQPKQVSETQLLHFPPFRRRKVQKLGQRWWPPGEWDSGEPGMPNDTFFLREANLYVDVDDYARIWMAPDNELKGTLFKVALASGGWVPSPLSEATQALADLRAAQDAGLLQPDTLRIFNEAMKSTVVSEGTTTKDLARALERAGRTLKHDFGISQPDFRTSPLCNWPLYWIA